MKTLRVYDPPLCCSSGVCGPAVDPELVRVNADLEWLKKQGVTVTRFNLAQQPVEFASNDKVKNQLQEAGQDSLPLTFMGDHLVASRFYPTRDQLCSLFELTPELTSKESCSCEPGGCC